jgi:hypothetical protein
VPPVLEFPGPAPGPFSQGQVTDVFPGSRNASGRVARQLADAAAFSRPGEQPSEAARVLAGRGDVSGGGFGDRAPPPRNLKARVESYLRDNGPSTTVQIVAALDSTPNSACGALGKANVECEDGRYCLADDE